MNEDIFSLTTAKEKNYICYQLTKYFINKNNSDVYSWCENPNCQYIYVKSKYSVLNVRDCPNCLKTFCILCGTELINNIHNQECRIMLLEKLKKEDKNWILKNTKNCPKCNRIYEKSSGCNHMKCEVCRPEIHFCFICGKILDKNK